MDAGAEWADLDPFAEALANAEAFGLDVGSFVANPADALILATLKESTASRRSLLAPDPTQPARRLIQGVRLFVSPVVTPGTVWGIPQAGDHCAPERRRPGCGQVGLLTSDRTAIRATMRVSFAFPHAAAIQKINLSD